MDNSNKKIHYTKKELNLIKSSCLTMTKNEIAQVTGRTPKAIGHALKKMGLKAKDGRIEENLKIGSKYGNFVVLGIANNGIEKHNCKYYTCQCVCENIREITKFNLINGFSNSCGCIGRGEKPFDQGKVSINEKYAICRYAASRRDLEFTLTLEQYSEIVLMDCHYCGIGPQKYNRYLKNDGSVRKNIKENGRVSQLLIDKAWVNINTLDRIDSNQGYVLGNCVSACWPCNEAKMDTTYDKFIERAYRIVEYQEKKKK